MFYKPNRFSIFIFLSLITQSVVQCILEVKHWHAAKQLSGTTCGYYALAHAQAIQNLFMQKKLINENTVKEETERILKSTFGLNGDAVFEESIEMLNAEDFVNLERLDGNNNLKSRVFSLFDEKNSLKNSYLIEHKQENPFFIIDSSEIDNDGYALLDIKKKDDRRLVNFICNIGGNKSGHFVYIGVLKEQNKAPYIIYIDSIDLKGSTFRSEPVEAMLNVIQNAIENNIVLTEAVNFKEPTNRQEVDKAVVQKESSQLEPMSKEEEEAQFQEAVKQSLEEQAGQQDQDQPEEQTLTTDIAKQLHEQEKLMQELKNQASEKKGLKKLFSSTKKVLQKVGQTLSKQIEKIKAKIQMRQDEQMARRLAAEQPDVIQP